MCPQFNLNRVSIVEAKGFNFVNPSSRGGTISCPMFVLGDKAILGGKALGKASSASSNHSLVRDDAALGGMPFAMILSGGARGGFFDEIEWKCHLGSTDVVGRVLHWSPTRGAASKFFFFFRFVPTQL